MRILVTGGAGFIGSNFIFHILNTYPEYQVINLDALTYAGNLESLKSVQEHPNYSFVHGNIMNVELVDKLVSNGLDAIVNFAAESHVDRSITQPDIFVKTNVLGTQVLLEAAKKHKISRYIQISTDEVYGSLGASGLFTEQTPLAPNSPYSASKAGSDLLARAYYETMDCRS
jgi:dTDP-glucose 4,6-dehydratase